MEIINEFEESSYYPIAEHKNQPNKNQKSTIHW